MTRNPKSENADKRPDAMQRMNKALQEALKTPPKPHKDEPKRSKGGKEKRDAKDG